MEEKLTPWQQYKKNLGTTRPWDLLDPNAERATDDIKSSRMEVCNLCPELVSITKQCKKCGCFMPLKTTLSKAVCPIGKW